MPFPSNLALLGIFPGVAQPLQNPTSSPPTVPELMNNILQMEEELRVKAQLPMEQPRQQLACPKWLSPTPPSPYILSKG